MIDLESITGVMGHVVAYLLATCLYRAAYPNKIICFLLLHDGTFWKDIKIM